MDRFLQKKQSEEIKNIRHAMELGITEFVSTFSKLIAPYAEFLHSIRPKIDSYKPALERIAEAAEALEALDKLGDNQYVLWKPLSRELVAAIKTADTPEKIDLCFGRILFLRCGDDLHAALNDVEERIQFRDSVRELLMEFPVQFVYHIVDDRLIGWVERLLKGQSRSSPWKEHSGNEDIGIKHDPHSADSSQRDCVIHSATSSSVNRPAFSASPFICS